MLEQHVMTMYGIEEVQIFVFLILAPDRGRWSASHSLYFTLTGRSFTSYWARGLVNSAMVKIDICVIARNGTINQLRRFRRMKMVSNGMIVMKIGQLLILWGIQDGVAGVLTRLWAG